MEQKLTENDIRIIYNDLIDKKYSYNDIVIFFFLKYYINITTYDFYKKENNIKIIYNKLVKQNYSYNYIVGHFFVKHYININSYKFNKLF
jgi:hypothetical protein